MKQLARHRIFALMLALAIGAPSAGSLAYPLTGYEITGIRRLHAYAPDSGFAGAPTLPSGSRLPVAGIRLRLEEQRDVALDHFVQPDAQLQAGLEVIFAEERERYSIAMLDITDPQAPRYAAVNERKTYLPGSVGKLLVTVGLFDALARVHPQVQRRVDVLRSTMVTADSFIQTDSHTVPVVDMEARTLIHRPIQLGDRFSLYEWIDHALSPSSNAAGATIWKQAMLIARFGADYPVDEATERAWLSETGAAALTRASLDVLERPLVAAGLEPEQLRQGTLFTRGGSGRIPGVASYASPRELLRLLIRLEQGLVVDRFTSLEIKRLLYFTRRRYRYAVSPALEGAAVYFKSGSFYRCREEPGFKCAQYAGNDTNLMNSVAIVENPAQPAEGQTQRVYLVAMMSNVLRKNSAADHRDIATRIDELVARLHP